MPQGELAIMKKILTIILLLTILSGMLSACGQVQPNEGTRGTVYIDNEGDHTFHSIGAQIPQNTYNDIIDCQEYGIEGTNVLKTDYYDGGTVSYQVLSLTFFDNWQDAGISEDSLILNPYKDGDMIFCIQIRLSNIDVPANYNQGEEGLKNCFRLYCDVQNDAEISDYGPTYINYIVEESYRPPDLQRYSFQHEFPAEGESIDIVFYWVLIKEWISPFMADDIYLLHTFSDSYMPIYYEG